MRTPVVCVAQRSWSCSQNLGTDWGGGGAEFSHLSECFLNSMSLCVQLITWVQVSLSMSGKEGSGGGEGLCLGDPLWVTALGLDLFMLLWHQQVPGRAGRVPQSQSQSENQLSSVATERREVRRYSRATVGGSEDRVFQVASGAFCVLDSDTATGLSFLFSGSSLPLLAQNPRLVWEVVAESGEGSEPSWYQRKGAGIFTWPSGALQWPTRKLCLFQEEVKWVAAELAVTPPLPASINYTLEAESNWVLRCILFSKSSWEW